MSYLSDPMGYRRSQDAINARGNTLGNGFMKFTVRDIEQSTSGRFEQQAAKFRNRPALTAQNAVLSYDSLNGVANRIARAILAMCGESTEPVGLLFEQGANVIPAMLGAMKAGKIDVPLDPVNPIGRMEQMMEDSRARLIVTDHKYLPVAQQLARKRCRLLNVDALDGSLSAENLNLTISPDAPARILYTSGSTGRPKGVIQHHRRILHEVMTNINGCYVGSEDRVSLITSPSTSQGTVVTYTALLSGAALCLFNLKQEGVAALADWLKKERITVYTSVRAIFRLFASNLRDKEEFPDLRLIALGGDQVRKGDVELYRNHFSQQCLLKVFLSSTETGNLCQYAIDKVSEITTEIVPVGYPSEGMDILLLDPNGEHVGCDEVGEIAVCSRYLSPGYWQRPDLTESKFLPDPAGGDRRLYLTGDLGQKRADGCLHYLGRKDLRVKIAGYSIELGEVESALLNHTSVREAVIVAIQDDQKDAQMVAYVIAARPKPTSTQLRNFLKQRLPEVMVPSRFIVVDSFPLTPMGKIDRQALLDPERFAAKSSDSSITSEGSLEQTIADVWKDVLRIENVDMQKSFFDLGGNSMLLIEAHSKLSRIVEQPLTVTDLFQYATVNALAGHLRQQEARESTDAQQRRLKELKAGQTRLRKQARKGRYSGYNGALK